jgi:hypothetical protein
MTLLDMQGIEPVREETDKCGYTRSDVSVALCDSFHSVTLCV